MIVFLNGQFLPEHEARVSVLDRGFLYGDGLFETMRVVRGRPFRWAQHWARLRRGAELLRIMLPISTDQLREHAAELVRQNGLTEGLLRLAVSRGSGARGYSIQQTGAPTVVMTLHSAPVIELEHPPRWRLVTSTFHLAAGDPLAAVKSANKLPQILARIEAGDRGADEALLVNTHGEVVEGTSANLFWVSAQTVCTPPVKAGTLPGITRAVVIELCDTMGLPWLDRRVYPEELRNADGVFLTLSSLGIVEATALDGHPLATSPLVPTLQKAYWRLVESECGMTNDQ